MSINPLIKATSKAFLDAVKIKVKAGRGGIGLAMYGGIGGQGGDVIIKGSKRTTLNALVKKNPTKIFIAGDGQFSRKTILIGKKGTDCIIEVPIGVTINDDRNQFVADINSEDDQAIVAMGGRGGDKFSDNHGFVGQTRILDLLLKTISDVGFVGFPNAGKSTLLRTISNAKPKVAAYPFTTLRPHLGIVDYLDLRQISVTDLPGLVEGAHENIGLGHSFLRHVERARMLVFLTDVNGTDVGDRRNPVDAVSVLIDEIERYDDTILKKPSILLVTKMDTADMNKFESIKNEFSTSKINFEHILPISSHNGLHINQFKEVIREVIDATSS